MKKSKLLLIPVLSLLLASCSGGGNNPNEEGDFKVYVYLDYNHYDPENPYLTGWGYYGVPFTKADLGLTDPDPSSIPDLDPYYPNFLGWSRQVLVDDTADLWKFGEDKIEKGEAPGDYIELFGIFVGA